MSIKNLSPYITLDGTASDAIALYERVFGATKLNVTRAADVAGADVSPDQQNRVIHGALRIGQSVLMVSDAASASEARAGNVQVALDFADIAHLTRTFAALAEDGEVTLPVQDTFWGAKFGMLTDRFGVRWLLNCEIAKQ